MAIAIKMPPKPRHRVPDKRPVFAENDIALRAVVVADKRLAKFSDAYRRNERSISIERFLDIYRQMPGASQDDLVRAWADSVKADVAAYADGLAKHYRQFWDDATVAAYQMSVTDSEDQPNCVGLRPTTDDAMKIVEAFNQFAIAAERRGVVADVLDWLGFQPAISKAYAQQQWYSPLRHRSRYRSLRQAVVQRYGALSREERAEWQARASLEVAQTQQYFAATKADSAVVSSAPFVSGGDPGRDHESKPPISGRALYLRYTGKWVYFDKDTASTVLASAAKVSAAPAFV
jgi:hypothetical protein